MRYLMMGLVLVTAVGIGMLIGIFIGTNRMGRAIEQGSVGDLRIDRSEPNEPPKPCLEIYKGNTIETISKKKFVILKIINESYLSRV